MQKMLKKIHVYNLSIFYCCLCISYINEFLILAEKKNSLYAIINKGNMKNAFKIKKKTVFYVHILYVFNKKSIH